MNSVHDMGGMHGLGPIALEADEPLFHAEWERRMFALNLAAGALGAWNLDRGRHARERIPGEVYLAASYYEKWAIAVEMLCVETGLVTAQELAAKQADLKAPVARTGHERVVKPERVEAGLRKGSSAKVDAPVAARFRVGDRVRARRFHPTGHTRLPRYARGAVGVIDRDHGVHIFADAHAAGEGQQPQHLYSVKFDARALWGESGHPKDVVFIDLWDAHLEALPAGAAV